MGANDFGAELREGAEALLLRSCIRPATCIQGPDGKWMPIWINLQSAALAVNDKMSHTEGWTGVCL